MAVVSIQSHVAFGRVGNRAAVFALERLGHEVWPIHTVQFSNHTGYGSWTGEVFPGSHIEALWEGLRARIEPSSLEALLSGYMGSVETGRAILKAVDEAKALNPRTLYCCDPVMGDSGRLYVSGDIVSLISAQALRRADIITPNHFEAELLSGMDIRVLDDAKKAAAILHEAGPGIVLVTSFSPEDSRGRRASMFLSAWGECALISTPLLTFSKPPSGAGDLAAAVFLGRYLECRDPFRALEAMTDSVYAVLERGAADKSGELRLVEAQRSLAEPLLRFKAEPV